MRTYKKRTKSTKSKTYKEYLEMRKELAGKGYELKEVLSERQFKEAYDMLKEAKKRGDIKSSPWAELKRRERYITSVKQARVFVKAAEERYGEKFTLAQIYSMTPAQITLLGDFINRTKDTGLYGGSYE